MAFIAIAPARAQQSRSLKSEMEVIHESLGVNFVYDSAIEIDVPYSGKPMKDVINANKKEHSVLLEECLQAFLQKSRMLLLVALDDILHRLARIRHIDLYGGVIYEVHTQ